MQNARLDEAQPGIKIAGRNNYLRYTDDTSLVAESREELKNLFMRVKEENEKAGLNSTFKKQRSWLQSHHFTANRWETRETVKDYFLGLQNHYRW